MISKAPKEVIEWFWGLGGISQTKNLSALTGLGIDPCRRAIKLANTGNLEIGPGRGRPKKVVTQEVTSKVLEIVTKANEIGEPISSKRIIKRLQEDHNITENKGTVISILHALGLYWGGGIRHVLQHDSPANVAYRSVYLRRRFENLVPLGNGKYRPIVPEVFLDESYCHPNHTASSRWVMKNGGTTKVLGRKPHLVIFAAFIVQWNEESQEVEGQFVKDT